MSANAYAAVVIIFIILLVVVFLAWIDLCSRKFDDWRVAVFVTVLPVTAGVVLWACWALARGAA